MKRIIYLTIMAFLVASAVKADEFKIREKKGADVYDVSYAKVTINRGKTEIFNGTTDKYGRIAVNLPDAQYKAEVLCANRKRSVQLTVDGQKNLKVVYLD